MSLRFKRQKTKVMKRFLFIASIAFIGFGAQQALRAQKPALPDEKRATQPQKRGGVFTMYALDPLARTLCFKDGEEGMAIINNDWGNRCSDLSFSHDNLVSGIEVNREAAIVDLGKPDDLRSRYGFEDAIDGGAGFASLHLAGDKIMILKQDHSKPEFQPLQEGRRLFTEIGPNANAQIKLGHIYLVRITDKKDASFQQLVKLMVIAYRPNESVTLRWESL